MENWRMSEEETEIDLIHLCGTILAKWRILLVAAICGALLAGGFKYVQMMSGSGMSDEENSYQTAIEEYNQKLLNEKSSYATYLQTQRNYQDQIRILKEQIDDKKQYVQESKLMNLDFENVYRGTMESIILMDAGLKETGTELWDPADSIGQAYADFVNGGMDLQSLASVIGVDEKYAQELVSAWYSIDSNILYVNTSAEDEKTAQDALDFVGQAISDYHVNMEKSVGKHTLELVQNTVQTVRDTGLKELAISNQNAILELDTTRLELEKKLSELKLPSDSASKELAKIKSPIESIAKFSVIGCIGLIAVFVMYYGFLYIISNKVHTNDDIATRYGIRELGCFAKTYQNNTKLDVVIRKLMGENSRIDSAELMDKISFEMKAEDVKEDNQLLFVVSVSDSKMGEANALREKVSDTIGKTTNYVRGEFQSVDAIAKLHACEQVVLIIERDWSKMSDVDKIVKDIYMNQKKIAGYVLY